MTTVARTFDTGIARSRAVLADPPAYWSYSTLKELTDCPLRYCLAHASYPALWSGLGYPPLPSPTSLFGNVVHGALEVVLRALSDAGVASPRAEEAAQVLVGLGGLRTVIDSEIARQVTRLATNPRLSDERKRRIHRDLQEKTQDARAQVQTYLSRTQFVPGSPDGEPVGHSPRPSTRRARSPLADGSHAEAWLVADRLRLHGRVDLVTVDDERVEIVDFKTGAQSPSHADQLRLYALLWSADDRSNPRHTEVTRLTASYPSHDIDTEVPDAAELAGLSTMMETEISVASREAASSSPTARPSAEACTGCGVRHLCPNYWASVAPREVPSQDGSWFDFEGVIGAENGLHSWWLHGSDGKRRLLLRATVAARGFGIGDCVRLLGLRRESDPDVSHPIGSMSVGTEVFVLEASN